jgi:hypothetical protein
MLEPLIGFMTFVSPVARFAAVWAEVFDSLTVAPLGIVDPAVAIIPVIGFCGGRASQEEKAAERQDSERRLAEERTEGKNLKFHKSLQERLRAGFG